MYLKQLYAANKIWFIIIMLFIIIQVAMDVRQDIAASPVYHYGMYSNKISPQKEYSVIEIYVNGMQLQAKDYSPYIWDKINQPAELFKTQQAWNTDLWNTDIKRLLHIRDSTRYVNHITAQQFNSWYKNYVAGILYKAVDTIAINTSTWTFNGTQLIKKNN